MGLTDQENYGHDLFYASFASPLIVDGVPKFSNCAFCHSDNPGNPFGPIPVPPDTGAEELQTYADDGYHNIGTPPNPEIPDTGVDSDAGLYGHTGIENHKGFHKTPTLRNVDKRPHKCFTKAYTHNGWFKSLESIVHFYNTAFLGGAIFPGTPEIPYENTTAFKFGVTRCPDDVTTEKDALKHNCWPAPAYSKPGIAVGFLVGDLGLTPDDEAAIVAYLKTLTDTYTAKPPKPYKPKKRPKVKKLSKVKKLFKAIKLIKAKKR